MIEEQLVLDGHMEVVDDVLAENFDKVLPLTSVGVIQVEPVIAISLKFDLRIFSPWIFKSQIPLPRRNPQV